MKGAVSSHGSIEIEKTTEEGGRGKRKERIPVKSPALLSKNAFSL